MRDISHIIDLKITTIGIGLFRKLKISVRVAVLNKAYRK